MKPPNYVAASQDGTAPQFEPLEIPPWLQGSALALEAANIFNHLRDRMMSSGVTALAAGHEEAALLTAQTVAWARDDFRRAFEQHRGAIS